MTIKKNKNAKETLIMLIDLLVCYLEELAEFNYCEEELFQYGEKTAYVECLEAIQCWDKAKEHGLNFEIEKKYPL